MSYIYKQPPVWYNKLPEVEVRILHEHVQRLNRHRQQVVDIANDPWPYDNDNPVLKERRTQQMNDALRSCFPDIDTWRENDKP